MNMDHGRLIRILIPAAREMHLNDQTAIDVHREGWIIEKRLKHAVPPKICQFVDYSGDM